MTPQTIITTARNILNDTDATSYRQSNTELLDYVNAGLKEISALQPSVFNRAGTLLCTISTVEQTLDFATAQALVGVIGVTGGSGMTQFDVATMEAFNPGWRSDTAGAAKQWAKYPNDPLRFFIYPKAPGTAQTLDVVYIGVPTTWTISQTITEVPAAYEPALVDYVVYRAESKDDEHSNSGRATASYAAFIAKIKGS